jgi:hypothetical protein
MMFSSVCCTQACASQACVEEPSYLMALGGLKMACLLVNIRSCRYHSHT